MKNLNEKQLVGLLVNAGLIEDVESVTHTYINEYDSSMAIESVEGDFVIYNNYSDAENDAIEICKNIIEDCGIGENLLFEAEIQGMIDESWFEDFWRESNEFQAYEEDIQYIASDEQLEQLENGDITEDEIRENYLEGLNASIDGHWMDEYKYQFGESEFQRVLIQENLVDIEELSKYCVDIDGVGHFIASYDGEETEHEGYYIYRTN
jgi:hypothetical protein